jgi:AtzE family amidohydrolase
MSYGPDRLLVDMAALLRSGQEWADADPAPQFDPYSPYAALPPGSEPAAESSAPSLAQPSDGVSATSAAAAALAGADLLQPELNMFTSVFREQLPRDAERLDDADPGPMFALPVAVKDLFDVGGTVTLAGSAVRADGPPAERDSTTVARLRAAGALLVGATNMDEFAYGFTTENSHYGPTRNPHDPARVAGGSSGGSAAAVAAGVVRIAIGTDTNGSIRIPAAFCGVYGLRPTYGCVPRTGSVPFVPGLDAVGPLARTPQDLALAMDVLAGPDGVDPSCGPRRTPSYRDALGWGIDGLRVARASGELWDGADEAILAASLEVSEALGAVTSLALPDVARARAAAIVITAAEGAAQHRELLVTRPDELDPRTRGRFLAGLGVPAVDYVDAQRFRQWWQHQVAAALADVDVLVVPATPCLPPVIDQPTVAFNGVQLPTGAVLGRFTQPLSLIGLPSLVVPVVRPGGLPIGVQLVGRPGADATLIAAAAHLHSIGVASTGTPALSVEIRALQESV